MSATNESTTVAGVAWDLSTEYPAADAPEIEQDLEALTRLLEEIEPLSRSLAALMEEAPTLDVEAAHTPIDQARQIYRLSEEAAKRLQDPAVFANCLLSVDSQDSAAQALQGRLQKFQKRYAELMEPFSQFLDRVPEAVIERFLDDEDTAQSVFLVHHSRERRHELLGLAEENLISALGLDGIHAWGRLYTQLSGSLSCTVPVGNEPRTMGLAAASGLMQRSDDGVREAAWRAVNDAWRQHAETCAASVNAIAGWRLELCRKRSHQRPVHFLDAPVHLNRLTKPTLDSMLSQTETALPLSRRAAKLMGRAYGKDALGPWDMRAPAPNVDGADERAIPFDDAVELIAEAYGEVHAEMGDFIRMMAKRRWIEGTVSDRKRPGAYCTGFAKSRTPRVYMTYTGTTTDVITLAHELGHAFHGWVMRDLPEAQKSYGMSLAETASTFGETTVRDALLRRAETPAAKLGIVWEEMSALTAFLLNIPVRFEFERKLYQQRDERPLRPAELEAMMTAAWEKWYADALSEPDPMFWASKLHFHISGLSFYNFPYLFGYLFSMGIYLRREAMGADFYSSYTALLRDTGRMTARDLTLRYLEEDLEQPDFWRDTIAALAPRVDAFESLLGELGLNPPR